MNVLLYPLHDLTRRLCHALARLVVSGWLLLWLAPWLSAQAQSVCTYTNIVPLPNFTGNAYRPYTFYHADGSSSPTFYRGETIYSYAVNTTGACKSPSGTVYITPVMPTAATALCTPIVGAGFYGVSITSGLYIAVSKTCQKVGPVQYIYSQHQKFAIATPGTYPVSFQNGNGTTLNLTIVSRVCVTTTCGNFDGVYDQTGMRNGKVDLFDQNGNELYYENGDWQISNAAGIAFQVSSSADYPPTTGWQSVGACAGVAISVAEGDCPLPTYSIKATVTDACDLSGDYVQTGVQNGRPFLAGPNNGQIAFDPHYGWGISRIFSGPVSQGGGRHIVYGINSVAYEPPASDWLKYDFGGGIYCTTDPVVTVERILESPQPVTLRYFNGRMTDAGALLGWQTATETNNAYFSVERSRDVLSFETIANLPAGVPPGQSEAGRSLVPLTYSYLDKQPLPGVNYYRLTQTDRDGTLTRHKVIALSREDQQPVLYPNPLGTLGEATLEPALPYRRYELTDLLGRVVQQSAGPGTLSRLSVGTLPAGVYVLRVQTEEGTRVFRVLR